MAYALCSTLPGIVKPMLLSLDDNDSRPIYRQLTMQVKAHIRRVTSLPSVRELVSPLGINLHTVHKAYQTLRDGGVIQLLGGRVPPGALAQGLPFPRRRPAPGRPWRKNVSRLLMSGGIRTSVTPGGVAVRVGFLGLPILHLGARDIGKVVACAFNPPAEFAGYRVRSAGAAPSASVPSTSRGVPACL